MTAPRVALIFDVELRRPACALIQAAAGCPYRGPLSLFDAETWLVYPTDGMRRVSSTREEWQRIAAQVNAARRQTPERAGSHP